MNPKHTNQKYCSYKNILPMILIVILLLFLLSGCTSNYQWGWYTISPFTKLGKSNLSFLMKGILPTLQLSFLAYIVSVALGLVVSMIGQIKRFQLSKLSRSYIAIFRSIPVLVLLLWVYYGAPIALSLKPSIFLSALITMSLCESAFIAEIFRAGIESVSKSQVESAKVMGARTIETYIYIILPQVFVKMLPALMNQLIYMIKISSLASIIGFSEITKKASELNVLEQRPLEIYTALMIAYLLIIMIVSFIEKHIAKALGPAHEE